MITLFASIAGFLGSFFPEVLRFIKDKGDKRHELDLMNMQMKFTKQVGRDEPKEIEASIVGLQYDQTLYATYKSGVQWVDAFNGTVRPMLAYCFFIMYCVVKILQYKSLLGLSNMAPYVEILWNQDDQAIFAGIISFYFGQRTFSKMRKR